VERWTLPTEPGCIAPARSGGFVMALRDGIYRAASWGGPLAPLARFNHDPAVMRFNDGKCDALGRLWAGTMYEPRDARRADLYCIDCRPDNGNGGKPQVSLKAHNAIMANGLAFAPDAGTLYWADTTNHIVHAWDYEVSSNVMKRHRVFHQFEPKPAGWTWKTGDRAAYRGRPDGAAMDAQGCYWIAMMEGARIARFSPQGEEIASLPVPVLRPTMPCFGGDDLRTLYVTTIGQNADEHAAYPDSGRVLSLRVDVPGLPVNFFVD
jgi:sugar lactone lactonase YvrE